jgi:hypothetical protein
VKAKYFGRITILGLGAVDDAGAVAVAIPASLEIVIFRGG